MNYLLYLSIVFLLPSVYKPQRFEWLVVSVMSFLLWLNVNLYTPVDNVLYWNRAIIVTIAGMLLAWRCTFLSIHHAIILFITLIAFAALAYDVSQGKHILIYDNFEAVIYGIVVYQFFSVFPTLWVIYHNHNSDRRVGLVNLLRDQRT